MQYGVCGGPDRAAVAAQAGYEFFEWTVGAFLKPREDEAAFDAARAQVETAGLPCPVVNCFVPADLKITGPAADLAALETYVTTTLRRAQTAGVAVIVFGSGGARHIPDGFDRDEAHGQIVAFCRMLAPIAEAHGVTVVVEPLNQGECNVLTSVAESADLVNEVNHPALRLLVDGYHWLKDDGAVEAIVSNGPLLVHAHVATVPNRLPPGAEECDLETFFMALRDAGYDGRVSFEGKCPEPEAQLPKALEVMKSLAD